MEIVEKNWETSSLQEKCEYLHEISFGYQDETLRRITNIPRENFFTNIKPTGTVIPITITKQFEVNEKGYNKIKLNDLFHFSENKQYGIQNIRVKENKDTIFDLTFGGTRMERIGFHNYWKDENGFFVFEISKDNIIPLLKIQYHDIYVEFSHKEQIEVTVTLDYVEFETNTDNLQKQIFDFQFRVKQFTGIKNVKGGDENQIRLNFNHPVEALDIISSKMLKSVVFDICKETKLPINIPFTEEKDGYFVYHIDLKPTVNFTGLDEAYLKISCDEDAEIYTFGTNLGIMRCMSGMYGNMFTK